MLYKMTSPKIVRTVAITKAVVGVNRPEGTGRFLVRSIFASESFSMIWVKAFDAPTIQYPPTANIKSVIQLLEVNSTTPSKYPAIDEKTTLAAKRNLVISLNSEIAVFIEKVVSVEVKAVF